MLVGDHAGGGIGEAFPNGTWIMVAPRSTGPVLMPILMSSSGACGALARFQHLCLLAQAHRGLDGVECMFVWGRTSKQRHEPIASGFIDLTAVGKNGVRKAAK